MTHTRLAVLALLAVILLSGCGGSEQEGVTLQAAGGQESATTTPLPEPTGTAPVATVLTGHLLILKGQEFELLDLATGDTLPFEDLKQAEEGQPTHSFSPADLSTDQTRGAFIAFPNYGVIDLTTNQIRELRNTGSNLNAFQISPDGQWIAALVGSFRLQLRLIDLNGDGMDAQVVASSAETGFNWGWTTDSQLVWWETVDDPNVMIFDPASGESTPAGDTAIRVGVPAQISPDQMHMANVPVAPGGTAAQDNPALCFDSYVELIDLPLTADTLLVQGRTIWTETGLVAVSPVWLTNDLLLFVKLGTGTCGEVQGEPERAIMLLDTSNSAPRPRQLAGPLGNADDPNDRTQQFGRQVAHLLSPSPDGAYVAWVGGGLEARETTINVTDVAAGTTQTVLRLTSDDLADFIENTLIRQVIWLP